MRKLLELEMGGDTYYLILGVPETATLAEIKRISCVDKRSTS